MTKTYQVLVCGQVVSAHARKAQAIEAARRLNQEAERELGEELLGDGAASVRDIARGEWVRVDG